MSTTDTDKQLPCGPEETRRRLIMAGLTLFGRNAYENVTTRALCAQAHANQSAIPYHFGGKEGLYLAVAESVVDVFRNTFSQVAARVHSELTAGKTPQQGAGGALRVVYSSFFSHALLEKSLQPVSLFLLREYQEPGAAFDIIYTGALQDVHKMMTRIVASATGLPEESPQAILRAQALMGLMFAFVPARHVLFRRMGWDGYTPERAAAIVDTVTQMGRNALGIANAPGACDPVLTTPS